MKNNESPEVIFVDVVNFHLQTVANISNSKDIVRIADAAREFPDAIIYLKAERLKE